MNVPLEQAHAAAMVRDLMEERGLPKRVFVVWNTDKRFSDFDHSAEYELIKPWHDSMDRLKKRLDVVMKRLTGLDKFESWGSCNYYGTHQVQGCFVTKWNGVYLHWPVHVQRLRSGVFMTETRLLVSQQYKDLMRAWWAYLPNRYEFV